MPSFSIEPHKPNGVEDLDGRERLSTTKLFTENDPQWCMLSHQKFKNIYKYFLCKLLFLSELVVSRVSIRKKLTLS